MKQLFFIAFLLLGTGISHAQIQEVVHQMHRLPSSYKTITIDLEAPLEVRKTSGNRIMVETHVKLKHSNNSLFNFMVKNGRYDLNFKAVDQETNCLIQAKALTEINLGGKKVVEEISYIIYVPHFIDEIKQTEEKTVAIQN